MTLSYSPESALCTSLVSETTVAKELSLDFIEPQRKKIFRNTFFQHGKSDMETALVCELTIETTVKRSFGNLSISTKKDTKLAVTRDKKEDSVHAERMLIAEVIQLLARTRDSTTKSTKVNMTVMLSRSPCRECRSEFRKFFHLMQISGTPIEKFNLRIADIYSEKKTLSEATIDLAKWLEDFKQRDETASAAAKDLVKHIEGLTKTESEATGDLVEWSKNNKYVKECHIESIQVVDEVGEQSDTGSDSLAIQPRTPSLPPELHTPSPQTPEQSTLSDTIKEIKSEPAPITTSSQLKKLERTNSTPTTPARPASQWKETVRNRKWLDRKVRYFLDTEQKYRGKQIVPVSLFFDGIKNLQSEIRQGFYKSEAFISLVARHTSEGYEVIYHHKPKKDIKCCIHIPSALEKIDTSDTLYLLLSYLPCSECRSKVKRKYKNDKSTQKKSIVLRIANLPQKDIELLQKFKTSMNRKNVDLTIQAIMVVWELPRIHKSKLVDKDEWIRIKTERMSLDEETYQTVQEYHTKQVEEIRNKLGGMKVE